MGLLSGLAGAASWVVGTARGIARRRKNPVDQVGPGLPAFLGGGGPGGFVSSHWDESRALAGWSFTAVRAVARACSKANPVVYATGDRARAHIDRATKAHKRNPNRVPWEVVTRLKSTVTASESGDDAVPLPPTFPLNRLLKKPNPWMSRSQFLWQHAQQACVTGSTMLWVRRNNYRSPDGRGVPGQLYVIPTGLMWPLPPHRDAPSGAWRVTPVGSFGGGNFDAQDPWGGGAWTTLMLTGGVIDGREILPVRWPHPLYLTDGLSPMAAGKLWMDIARMLDQTTFASIQNTTRPGYVFEMDPDQEEPTRAESDRFDAFIRDRVSGLQNIGRHVRLPKGVRIADADRSVQELGYVEGRAAVGRDVLSLWAVPPVATGHQEAGAYAAYYASLLQFREQAVEPVLALLADAIEHDLAPAYGEDLEVRIPAPPVNDKEMLEREFEANCANRLVTYNEARKVRKLPPWPVEYGGELPVGENLSPLFARELGIELPGQVDNNGNYLTGVQVDGAGLPSSGSGGKAGKPGSPPGGPKNGKPVAPGGSNPAARNKPSAAGYGPASRVGGASSPNGNGKPRKGK